jgi:hypothetical protein
MGFPKARMIARILKILLALPILTMLAALAVFFIKMATEHGSVTMRLVLVACACLMLVMAYTIYAVLLAPQADRSLLESEPVDSDFFFEAALKYIRAKIRSRTVSSAFLIFLFAGIGIMAAFGMNMGPYAWLISPLSAVSTVVMALREYSFQHKLGKGLRLVPELSGNERTCALGELAEFLKEDAGAKIIALRCREWAENTMVNR